MKEFKISLRLTVRTINTVFPVLRENSLKLLVKKNKKKYIFMWNMWFIIGKCKKGVVECTLLYGFLYDEYFKILQFKQKN